MVKKNLPAGDIRDAGLIPGSGRSPGVGRGNSFQYFCLENSMDREIYLATVHRATESDMTEHIYVYVSIYAFICTYVYIQYLPLLCILLFKLIKNSTH